MHILSKSTPLHLFGQIEDHESMVGSLNERISGLESDLKSSEDLLQEKLSALGQYEDDSAQLNEEILKLKESLTLLETERNQSNTENTQLQELVKRVFCSRS